MNYIKNKYFGDIITNYLNTNNIQSNYFNIDYYHKLKCKQCLITNQFVDVNFLGNKRLQYLYITKYNPNCISSYIPFTTFFHKNNISSLHKFLTKNQLWIIKPENGTFRRGITVIQNIQQLQSHINQFNYQHWIMQKYIDRPLLYNQYKFHFRNYIIVFINKNTIKTYLYYYGFMYLSKSKYNYQKIDSSYLSGEDSKQQVLLYPQDFIKKYGQNKYLYIDKQLQIIVKDTISSVKHKLKCFNTKNNNHLCYKLLGYDILIDQHFKLYLAEINTRLITFKYPPPNFKYKLYTTILDYIFYNKQSNYFKHISTIQKTVSTIEHYHNFHYNNLYLYSIIVILLIIVIYFK